MILVVLVLIFSNLSINKVIRPPMRVFDAPHSLHLNGELERRKYLAEVQPTSKVLMTNKASIPSILPLNFTIDMVVTPFEETFHEVEQKIFKAKLKMADNSTLLLTCVYEKGKKLRLTSTYNGGNKEETKVLEQLVQPLGWNKLSLGFYYQGYTVPIGSIETVVQFQETKPVFKGIVTNFSITIHNQNQQLAIINKKEPTEWIGTVDPISHPISLNGIVLPENLKSSKTPHTIPILGKGKKLLVCHDMMNGYKEDVNEYSNKFGRNAYRFNHWRITDLFVYFSHQNIAIPPKHYRMLCQREKVLCLATFIIEAPIDWLKFEMADFLIFLARQYEFDGYLINIEYPVSKPDLFKEWLTYLTANIHTQLPNSVIVLYDAIINDGSLRYQSGLSESNIDYMNTVDYFFSDYHWNLQSLETTVALAESIERGTDVFMGNDVFGRGTYGGGMFNTDIAVRQINKYNLSAAIFAPGYVYQNEGGKLSYSRFQQVDDMLWFGQSFVQKKLKYGDWAYDTIGWSQEGDDAVTSTTLGTRSYTYPLPNNNAYYSISFTVNIKGTPPNVKDPYSVIVHLLDSNGNSFKSVSTGAGYQYAKQNYEQIKLSITINQQDRKKVKSVKVVENGRDAENWGGYYGARFNKETLFFNYFKNQKSISDFYYERPQGLPFQSYYNVAVGPNYFFKGEKVIVDTGYTFLADYDLPYQNKKFFRQDKFNEKFNSQLLEVNYDQTKGWVGAGSLKVVSNAGKYALRLVKVQEKLDSVNVRLMIASSVEQLPAIGFKLKDGSTKLFECSSTKKDNWFELIAAAKFQGQVEIDSVYLVFDTNHSSFAINIGQISIFTSNYLSLQKYEPQLVAVRCSITSINCLDLYINFQEFPITLKSLFVQVDGKVVGTLYQRTGYFEQISADPTNASIKLLGLSQNGQISLIHHQKMLGK